MIQKLPVKKEYILIAAALILLLISYRFAFQNTIGLWQSNLKLKEQISRSGDLDYQPAYIDRKINNLNKIITSYKADTSLLRNNIINDIALIADKGNVKLAEVPEEDVSFHTNDFILEKLDFEGDYFSLLKMSNQLQKTSEIGIVRSEVWKAVGIKFNNDEKKKLRLSVYLEIAK